LNDQGLAKYQRRDARQQRGEMRAERQVEARQQRQGSRGERQGSRGKRAHLVEEAVGDPGDLRVTSVLQRENCHAERQGAARLGNGQRGNGK
jgi:hypothetical protein